MPVGKTLPVSSLIERHRALDLRLAERRDGFLSDWNGTHPFVHDFLGPSLVSLGKEAVAGDYIYLDERPAITESITRFHRNVESLDIQFTNVLAGAGSSSLLAAFALWLSRQGVEKIYYLPPIYHTLHYLLDLLRIEAIPLTTKHAFQPGYAFTLPDEPTVLAFCDPLWYAGKHVPASVITAISEWQERTGSLVFVDGSFQYLSWSPRLSETTSLLNPSRTFRVICPTKALAIHSYRFSYLLHPSQYHADFTFLYESLVGSAGVGNLAFGRRALEVLSTKDNTLSLRNFLRNTFLQLLETGAIQTKIEPDCGYYVFAKPLKNAESPNEQIVMDQDFFELTGYPGYGRINLMVARKLYLDS
jgi:hypothetical protein